MELYEEKLCTKCGTVSKMESSHDGTPDIDSLTLEIILQWQNDSQLLYPGLCRLLELYLFIILFIYQMVGVQFSTILWTSGNAMKWVANGIPGQYGYCILEVFLMYLFISHLWQITLKQAR